MKMIYRIMLTVSIVLMLCGNAFSEPYTGNDFPSEEQLVKFLVAKYGRSSVRIIGKHKDAHGTYFVYFEFPDGNLHSIHALRLDTGVWVLENQLLQK